ncbi:MAG: hypothetical protein RR475_02215 [Clostridia bacterium]
MNIYENIKKKVVIAAIAAIILFWIAETVLRIFNNGTGYSDTFTICWFTFWSVELSALAGIAITESRKSPYMKFESREEEIGG